MFTFIFGRALKLVFLDKVLPDLRSRWYFDENFFLKLDLLPVISVYR